MRQVLLVIILIAIMIGILYGLSIVVYPLIGIQEIIRPVVTSFTKERTLDQYAIENLRLRISPSSTISFDELTKESSSYFTYIFSYYSDGSKVTGQAHIPKETENAPIIIMFRGYAELDEYVPGYGTYRAGEVFAQNGYITLAPDFLGYGESDMPSENPMEERFQRYTTGLTLIDSISKLNKSLEAIDVKTTADQEKIGIWGHSNGGHIGLTMLEVTGANIPTVLWNPVTKPFPYSILYYTDDFDDYGKALRKLVADFEKDYDIDRYSLTTYLDWINAPIQLHQGSADDLVPQNWSDEFTDLLKDLDKDIEYFVYPGNDHNFAQGAWNTVIQRNLSFYEENFSE